MELLNYALNPANEYVMEELFNAGFESGEFFCFRCISEGLFVLPICIQRSYKCLIRSESMFTKMVTTGFVLYLDSCVKKRSVVNLRPSF